MVEGLRLVGPDEVSAPELADRPDGTADHDRLISQALVLPTAVKSSLMEQTVALEHNNQRRYEARIAANIARRELAIASDQMIQFSLELSARQASLVSANQELAAAEAAAAEAAQTVQAALELERQKSIQLSRRMAAAGFDKPAQPWPTSPPNPGLIEVSPPSSTNTGLDQVLAS